MPEHESESERARDILDNAQVPQSGPQPSERSSAGFNDTDASPPVGGTAYPDYRRIARRWNPSKGLSRREEEMVTLWLGINEDNTIGKRHTIDELAGRFELSHGGAARIVKQGMIKLVLIYKSSKHA